VRMTIETAGAMPTLAVGMFVGVAEHAHACRGHGTLLIPLPHVPRIHPTRSRKAKTRSAAAHRAAAAADRRPCPRSRPKRTGTLLVADLRQGASRRRDRWGGGCGDGALRRVVPATAGPMARVFPDPAGLQTFRPRPLQRGRTNLEGFRTGPETAPETARSRR